MSKKLSEKEFKCELCGKKPSEKEEMWIDLQEIYPMRFGKYGDSKFVCSYTCLQKYAKSKRK